MPFYIFTLTLYIVLHTNGPTYLHPVYSSTHQCLLFPLYIVSMFYAGLRGGSPVCCILGPFQDNFICFHLAIGRMLAVVLLPHCLDPFLTNIKHHNQKRLKKLK